MLSLTNEKKQLKTEPAGCVMVGAMMRLAGDVLQIFEAVETAACCNR